MLLLLMFIGYFTGMKIHGSAVIELSFIIKSNKFSFFLSDENPLLHIFGPMTIFRSLFWGFLLKNNNIFLQEKVVFEVHFNIQAVSLLVLKATCCYLD
jgi:hypothetical protein